VERGSPQQAHNDFPATAWFLQKPIGSKKNKVYCLMLPESGLHSVRGTGELTVCRARIFQARFLTLGCPLGCPSRHELPHHPTDISQKKQTILLSDHTHVVTSKRVDSMQIAPLELRWKLYRSRRRVLLSLEYGIFVLENEDAKFEKKNESGAEKWTGEREEFWLRA
jgi:hypothetical protein